MDAIRLQTPRMHRKDFHNRFARDWEEGRRELRVLQSFQVLPNGLVRHREKRRQLCVFHHALGFQEMQYSLVTLFYLHILKKISGHCPLPELKT